MKRLLHLHLLILLALLTGCAAPAAPVAVTTAPTGEQALPIFQSDLLNPQDTPRTYIQDVCKYLRARWNPNNAQPGTVVMIIALRNVRGGPVDDPRDIENSDLKKLMRRLREQGFEAINTEQLLNFTERNVYIPPRAVMFVRDGSYEKIDFEAGFQQYWLEWQWPIVNGWVSNEYVAPEVWQANRQFERQGFVDHQAGGVVTDALLGEETSKVVIARELQGSLDAFAKYFAKKPIAFVWPNGGFGQRPVETARLLGYQLGFTLNTRGPIMYNWVPLANASDPERPTYLPEGALKDPLMTLPRYLPAQALNSIDTVRTIGNEAAQYALAHKDDEQEYYQASCAAEYGPLPTPSK